MIDYRDCSRSSNIMLNITTCLNNDISNNKKSILVTYNGYEKRITAQKYNIDINRIFTHADVFLEDSLRSYVLDTIYFFDFVPTRSRLYEIIQFDKRGINCVIRVIDPEWHGQLEKHEFFYDYIYENYPEMLI